MKKIETERMEQVILRQRATNQLISKAIGCDERTAYGYSVQVRAGLTCTISNKLLVSMAVLCHLVGVDAFRNSLVPSLINASQSKTSIEKYIAAMLSH